MYMALDTALMASAFPSARSLNAGTRTRSSIGQVRFTYAEAMTDPTFYTPLAQAAEAAGYHAMTIAGQLAYPFESDSKYPYTADGNREFLDGKEFIEAFVLASALCAVTTTLRFNFFVLKLPIRPPALVAKQAGSLAALFDNRLGLGVGTSPWPEDYELMGVPFAKRGKRMDECIDIISGLTSGEYFEYHGEFYDIPKTKMTPAPTEPIPILVGGHADAALRRAARSDGWMHGGGGAEELDRLHQAGSTEIREEEGRTGPFEIHVISAGRLHPRRHQAARGQGRHRRHRRLPDALHHGPGHRAARGQDPPPGEVRGEGDEQAVSRGASTQIDASVNQQDGVISPRVRVTGPRWQARGPTCTACRAGRRRWAPPWDACRPRPSPASGAGERGGGRPLQCPDRHRGDGE